MNGTIMTKKIINELLTSIKCELDGCSLADLLIKAAEWIVEYGPDAKIDVGQEVEQYDYSNSQYVYVRIMGDRLETDTEYDVRVAQEEKYKLLREERDKAEFERLSKIFVK